jgi:hypothetical protein
VDLILNAYWEPLDLGAPAGGRGGFVAPMDRHVARIPETSTLHTAPVLPATSTGGGALRRGAVRRDLTRVRRSPGGLRRS